MEGRLVRAPESCEAVSLRGILSAARGSQWRCFAPSVQERRQLHRREAALFHLFFCRLDMRPEVLVHELARAGDSSREGKRLHPNFTGRPAEDRGELPGRLRLARESSGPLEKLTSIRFFGGQALHTQSGRIFTSADFCACGASSGRTPC
jgi:hypothetical protein